MSAASRLPTELWHRIFSFTALEDKPKSLVDLWISGRQICKAWRAQIAQTYLDTFIRNPSRCFLAFDCGIKSFEVGDKFVWPTQMVFDRLDPDDKGRCVFKESAETYGKLPDWGREQREEYKHSKYPTWTRELERYIDEHWAENWADSSDEGDASDGEGKPDRDEYKAVDSVDKHSATNDASIDDESAIEATPKNFEYPAHVLYIYGVANDTDLPGLKADVEKVEISFGWEGMLTALIMERAEFNRRTDNRIERIQEGFKARLPGGQMEPEHMEMMIEAVQKVKLLESRSALRVRRERIINAFKTRGRKEFRDGTWDFGWNSFDDGHERRQVERIEEAREFGGREDQDEDEEEEDDDENHHHHVCSCGHDHHAHEQDEDDYEDQWTTDDDDDDDDDLEDEDEDERDFDDSGEDFM